MPGVRLVTILNALSTLAALAQAYERYDPYGYITPDQLTFTGTVNDTTIVAITPPEATSDVDYIANAFYANYHSKNFTIDDIEWTKITSLTYGSIPIPAESADNITLTTQDSEAISQIVQKAETLNITTLLSFGGINGSAGFAEALASQNTIEALISEISRIVDETGVDGVELNWEYTQCSSDTPNTSQELSTAFLFFLAGLRETLPEKLITLAVGPIPFLTPLAELSFDPSDPEIEDGGVSDVSSSASSAATSTSSARATTTSSSDSALSTPFTTIEIFNSTEITPGDTIAPNGTNITTVIGTFANVTPFASLLDYIVILGFDLWGPWFKNGTIQSGAPLNATCGTSDETRPISITEAVASWSLSGFREDQIVLGVSGSGRSYRIPPSAALHNNGTLSTMPELIPSLKNTTAILGDAWWLASTNQTGTCNATTEFSPISGVFSFRGLINAGYLDKRGKPRKSRGILSAYDKICQSALVYDPKSEVLVTYDNAKAFKAKGEFVYNARLRGFSFYDAAADYSAILLDAIRKGAGFDVDELCGPDEEVVWLPVHPEDEQADGIDDTEEDEDGWDWIKVLDDSGFLDRV